MIDRPGATAVPVWFGPTERPLFGWLHAPADGRASGAAVLCPPLARERASVHASFRRLAERLAEAGLVAVRFDYDGTGDSAGTCRDPDRVEAWLASVAHAVALARSTGAPRVALVGMRMGALLAASSGARAGAADALVLWDPCWRGRTFVREQRAISLLRFGAEGPGGEPGELPGFRFDRPTAEALAGLALPTEGVRAASATLVLSRPGAAAPPAVTADLAGAPVTWERAPEEGSLLDAEPVRQRSVARIVAWLDRALAGPKVPLRTEPEGSAAAAVLDLGDQLVVERCRSLGPLGLVGIETSPVLGAGGPVVLMANAAADWRAGTNRLWVHLARELATRGLRSVRFDLSGLGDSPARPGQAVERVYAPEALEDVAAVAAAVSPEDPGDVVLVGLCSSAYLSLEGGLALVPRGLCAINPILGFTPPEMSFGPMDRRRRICQPAGALVRAYGHLPEPIRQKVRAAAWRLANGLARPGSARGQAARRAAEGVGSLGDDGDELPSVIDAARRTQSARDAVGDALALGSLRAGLRALRRRCAALAAGPRDPARWLAELVAGGVDVLCIGGEREIEPLLDGERRARYPLGDTGRLRLEVLAGLDHSLLFSPQRDELAAVLVDHLAGRFAPPPADRSLAAALGGLTEPSRRPGGPTEPAPSPTGGSR